ncbi:MAG: hypothetical protein OXU53_08960 [Deltaproteobacteria bacterium]|nr:hypothetical protein [Deltaproteobacteria bacterium]
MDEKFVTHLRRAPGLPRKQPDEVREETMANDDNLLVNLSKEVGEVKGLLEGHIAGMEKRFDDLRQAVGENTQQIRELAAESARQRGELRELREAVEKLLDAVGENTRQIRVLAEFFDRYGPLLENLHAISRTLSIFVKLVLPLCTAVISAVTLLS